MKAWPSCDHCKAANEGPFVVTGTIREVKIWTPDILATVASAMGASLDFLRKERHTVYRKPVNATSIYLLIQSHPIEITSTCTGIAFVGMKPQAQTLLFPVNHDWKLIQ